MIGTVLRPWGPQSQLPGASGLHDTNLNALSIQTPKGQKSLGHIKKEWQIKIMAIKKGLNFMRNSKLAHILVEFYPYVPVQNESILG